MSTILVTYTVAIAYSVSYLFFDKPLNSDLFFKLIDKPKDLTLSFFFYLYDILARFLDFALMLFYLFFIH